jgi:hypothetical protein
LLSHRRRFCPLPLPPLPLPPLPPLLRRLLLLPPPPPMLMLQTCGRASHFESRHF